MPSTSASSSNDPIIPARLIPGPPAGSNPELRPSRHGEHGRPARKQSLEPYCFRLESSTMLRLKNEDNPDNIVQEVRLRIICDEDEQDQEAGRAFLMIAHADRCEREGMVFDAMDAISQPAMEYCEAFYDLQGSFCERVAEQFGDTTSQGLLIIDHIDLAPQYRSQDLELLIADQILEVFGYGLGLAACRPFPAHGSDNKGPAEGVQKARTEAARKKLASCWDRLGFKQVGRTDYWALNLNLIRNRDFLKR